MIKLRFTYSAEWSIVSRWNPENRYKKIGSETKQTAFKY